MVHTFRSVLSASVALTSLALLIAEGGCQPAAIAPDASTFDSSGGGGNDGGDNTLGDTSIIDGFVIGTQDGPIGSTDVAVSPDAACAVSTVQAPRIPANILFVVDRSGSMNCNPPPYDTSEHCEAFPVKQVTTQLSKWEITRDALKSAIGAMPSQNSVGIVYFSNGSSTQLADSNNCNVVGTPDLTIQQVNPAHITKVNASLDAVVPKGKTPIVGGLTNAYQYIFNGVSLTGKLYVVLLTDGAETCNANMIPDLVRTQSDSGTMGTVELASSVGIRTFVLGAPGSEPARQFLSSVAKLGGTGAKANCNWTSSDPKVGDCHFDMTNVSDAGPTFAQQLNDALEAVSREALSCEFDVPKQTPDGGTIDYTKVNVLFTPSTGPQETISRDDNAPCGSGANGWQYTQGNQKIVLCGSACDKVKADTRGSVQILLGCATLILPPR